MTYEEIKMILEQLSTESKPAIASVTIWGAAIVLGAQVIGVLPEIITTIGPLLSPRTVVAVTAIGGLISIFGRVFGNNKPISGLVSSKV